MLKETLAIKAINTIIGTWENQKVKLEVAIKVLQDKIKNNEILIKQKEENVKKEIRDIKIHNETLVGSINKAENFKSGIDSMFNKGIQNEEKTKNPH